MTDLPTWRIAPLAEDDLEDIWRYSAETWSAAQAAEYHSIIIGVIERLADGSIAGRKVDVRDDYLKYQSGSHMIYFKRMDGHIHVVRILHQSMDVERHL